MSFLWYLVYDRIGPKEVWQPGNTQMARTPLKHQLTKQST